MCTEHRIRRTLSREGTVEHNLARGGRRAQDWRGVPRGPAEGQPDCDVFTMDVLAVSPGASPLRYQTPSNLGIW